MRSFGTWNYLLDGLALVAIALLIGFMIGVWAERDRGRRSLEAWAMQKVGLANR